MKRLVVLLGLLLLPVAGLSPAGGVLHAQQTGDSLNFELFEELLGELRDKYVEEIGEEELLQWGIEGILEHLDPYTDYYDHSRIEQLQSVTTGEYGGVGLYIDQQDGEIVVLSPISHSPASDAGLLPGDVIRAVAGRSIVRMPLDRVITLIKGDVGTTVALTVARQGMPDPLEFQLTRRIISIKDIPFYSMLDGGLGYIKLSHFSQKAPSDLAQAITDLQLQGMDNLILDLRGNPGGLLSSAVEVAELFLEKGATIVSTHGRRAGYEVVYRSQRRPLMAAGRLAVLVDGISASASEIVSGSIQDLKRGLLVGSRTFGKGLVQSIVYTDGGSALKLTTMRYYTPKGRSIDGNRTLVHRDGHPTPPETQATDSAHPTVEKGIQPDVPVDDSTGSPFIRSLVQRGMFVRFAIRHLQGRTGNTVEVTPAIIQEFQDYLTAEDYHPYSDLSASIDALADAAGAEQLEGNFYVLLDSLQTQVHQREMIDLDPADPWLKFYLTEALNWIADGEQARIASTLPMDPIVQRARNILQDPAAYSAYLTPERETAISSAP